LLSTIFALFSDYFAYFPILLTLSDYEMNRIEED